MKRIEVERLYGPRLAHVWGHDPNCRARVKDDLGKQLAKRLQIDDLIDFVVTTELNGDTKVVASILAARTGDEK